MTPQQIRLNGRDWRLLPMMPAEWEWRRVWERPERVTPSLWIPAVVPGTVQDDAHDAGLTPDFTHDFDSRACEWTSERDWVYLREFATPDVPPGGVVRLRFEGVDYACHVFLNGQLLGDHEGMYDAFEFDVTALLAPEGANTLVVVVEHAPREVGQIGRTSEVRIWKARFAYDWDWCTRLVPVGIWDTVSLEVTGPAFINDVQVSTSLGDDHTAADIGTRADVGAPLGTKLRLRTTLRFDGAVLDEQEATIIAHADRTGFWGHARIENPQLWWPNGYGEQAMYELTVALVTENGQVSDQRTVMFGVRNVRAIANDGASDDALPYVLEVNGQRVFIKGWNWAPISQLYGREMPERYERWLRLAANAHCNILRVNGVGLLEKEVFYDLCDRLGIMVWQEFIQSSSGIDNRPSEEQDYLDTVKQQAEKMIPRRRNHPSLTLWCGGNELMSDDWKPLDDAHPALAVLKDCVKRLDPDRIWLPTSGSGPSENASVERVGLMHDVHGPWNYLGPEEHYGFYNTIDPLLHAEFGVEGAANLDAMRRSNTEELLWPPDETNPLWMHKGSWWIQRGMMRRIFGEIEDLETYVRASQLLQAEGLRYGIEANRRRKWRCAGTSPWQFNETWPNLTGTYVLDYYGQPRAAYWSCRSAYEPLHVSARYDKLGWRPGETFKADIWLNSSLGEAPGCMVSWELCDLRGATLARGEKTFSPPAASATHAESVSWAVTDVEGFIFLLRLRASTPRGRESANDYVFSTAEEPVFAPLLCAPRTELRVAGTGEGVELTNVGDAFALFVRLEDADEGWVELSRNHLLLAPGEAASVSCRPRDRRVDVTGWNFGG